MKGNVVKFTKIGISDNKKLTDIVEITLKGDKFTGINRLSLQTLSQVDDRIIKMVGGFRKK